MSRSKISRIVATPQRFRARYLILALDFAPIYALPRRATWPPQARNQDMSPGYHVPRTVAPRPLWSKVPGMTSLGNMISEDPSLLVGFQLPGSKLGQGPNRGKPLGKDKISWCPRSRTFCRNTSTRNTSRKSGSNLSMSRWRHGYESCL